MELDERNSYELQYWFLVGPWQGGFASPGSIPTAPVAPQPLEQIQRPLGWWEEPRGPSQPAQQRLEAGDLSLHSFCCSTVGMEQPEDISGDFRARTSSPHRPVRTVALGAELGSWRVPTSETLATAGMGDVGQAPQSLRFLPAQTSVQPTPALGRFTEQQ